MPQRALRGRWTVQVAAEMPKTAHTWQRRTSAMSPGWSCGGTPHRAVQNQAFCRTGRPRRTVRYRKRPCGVREVHLSAGAARGGGSSAGRHVERMTGASGSRWRIVEAQVRRKPMRARWLQSRCDTMSSPELCRPMRNVHPAARSLSLSPCAVNSNIGPAENIRRNHLVSGKK